jgi:hypothetical protein
MCMITRALAVCAGAKKMLDESGDGWSDGKAAWIAAVCGAVRTVLSLAAIPFMKRALHKVSCQLLLC